MFKKTSITFGIVLLASVTVAHAAGFKLSSPTIKPNSKLTSKQVFNGFGCSGENLSPALAWSGAPKGTKSFAVTVYDPDAPTGSGWWHWVVYNIPASVTSLPEAAGDAAGSKLPEGAVQGRTDYGAPGFGGACPPKGDKPHRYIFTVYALKVDKLELPKEASPAMIGFMLKSNQLGSASFTAKYGR
ncbi:YbhB/YbcL family Raf kinase inhibitor-like protein [Geomesophilobacter sediminis]|uniref:YbhB/YbcL family Raf kinase inhibitor-like protein n=1 Tax=Geomesophilobacter sediminis TaxID=2798584 RepID=A0A8J7INH3_9BACT|nr:YbhB/YbcL family Raf kinase inhibitor-like protein [Geomesophilobacter sediminis]MBJ6723604.1 YbhB/YbcL family Raf kinase inhibitor-like protein [Geomesophilobacter sediminis]